MCRHSNQKEKKDAKKGTFENEASLFQDPWGQAPDVSHCYKNQVLNFINTCFQNEWNLLSGYSLLLP